MLWLIEIFSACISSPCGRPSDDFKKRLYGVRIKRIVRNGVVVPNRYSYSKFTLFKRAWQDGDGGTNNFDPKWYMAAFPVTEIYKDYGLTQNPGW